MFGRLDEILENITTGKQLAGDACIDSDLLGIDEVFMWLDIVAASTTDGPVMLALSRADTIPSPSDYKKISDHIRNRLNVSEHPIRDRLVFNEGENLEFFPLDNTNGLKGRGIRPYRDVLQQLLQASESARQIVPSGLIKFQDVVGLLTKPPAEGEHPMLSGIRSRAGAQTKDGCVFYLPLEDMALLYENCTESELPPGDKRLVDATFRMYLDFLDMQGVVIHSNAPLLEDLVIIDPMWMLRQVTRIVRRPSLHPMLADRRLVGSKPFRQLYERGILESKMVNSLWDEHAATVRSRLLGLMLEFGMLVTIDLGPKLAGFMAPSLLPAQPHRRWRPPKGTPEPMVVHLACYTGSDLLRFNYMHKDELRERCSMPAGIFEQLLAALLKIAHSSTTSTFEPILSRSYAQVKLGRYALELVTDPDTRTIKLLFYSSNVTSMLQQVLRAMYV